MTFCRSRRRRRSISPSHQVRVRHHFEGDGIDRTGATGTGASFGRCASNHANCRLDGAQTSSSCDGQRSGDAESHRRSRRTSEWQTGRAASYVRWLPSRSSCRSLCFRWCRWDANVNRAVDASWPCRMSRTSWARQATEGCDLIVIGGRYRSHCSDGPPRPAGLRRGSLVRFALWAAVRLRFRIAQATPDTLRPNGLGWLRHA